MRLHTLLQELKTYAHMGSSCLLYIACRALVGHTGHSNIFSCTSSLLVIWLANEALQRRDEAQSRKTVYHDVDSVGSYTCVGRKVMLLHQHSHR